MSDFSNIINGTTVNLGNTTSTSTQEPRSVVSVDPITGNPFGALTNSGILGLGKSNIGGFGETFVDKLAGKDSALFGNMLGGTGLEKNHGSPDTSTPSDKRLERIRSRAYKSQFKEGGGNKYTSDRGPISYIKLLKNPEYDINKAVEGARSNVSAEVSQLISSSGLTKFFLTHVDIQHSEKTQIMTTFGDNEVVYYFGRQPIVVNLSGLVFDSIEADWFSKFLTLYQRVLRGSQLAKNFCLVEIGLPNMRLVGTISSFSHQQESTSDTNISFSMQFIAKEVEPLPAELPKGQSGFTIGSLFDFKAGRSGFESMGVNFASNAVRGALTGSGVTLGSSGSQGSGFLDGVGKTITSGIGGLVSGAAAIGNTINSFRSAMFSPIFGIISSITKIVKSVTGSISSIISSFINPINGILRDITSVAGVALGIASMVESSVNNAITAPGRVISNIGSTLRTLKHRAGVISRVPENISELMKRQFHSNRLQSGALILSSGRRRNKAKSAVLSSGAPYSPQKSYIL